MERKINRRKEYLCVNNKKKIINKIFFVYKFDLFKYYLLYIIK